jgi:hypothetical protein
MTNYACGCDGITYEHACAAYAAGVDLSTTGGCPAPPGQIGCGPFFCNAQTEYCAIEMSRDPFKPNLNRCMVTECRACSCLPNDTPCHGTCVELPGGGLRLTCPAAAE